MNFRRIVARCIADGISPEIYPGRITVQNNCIVQVERGDFIPDKATDIFYDAEHLLAPAFIDAHGHSDISVFAMKEAQGKTRHGIAFEVSGNCGLTPFPISKHNRDHLQELYRQYQIPLDWECFTDYMQHLKALKSPLELFPQIGHNTLRACVNGYEKKQLSHSALSEMQQILDRELAAGAVGLSSGLLYVPGCFSTFEELTALLKIVAEHNKIYTLHLRSEGNDLENALQEALDAARAAGLKKLHISHIKTAGKSNFHKLDNLLNALATKDLRVTADIYCYDASMTQLSVVLPAPFDEYDDISLMKYLQIPQNFKQLLPQLRASRPPDYWQQVRIVSAAGPYSKFQGCKLIDAAEKSRMSPWELLLDIIRLDAAGATGAFHTLSSENMQRLAAHPSVVPGTDESARNCTYRFGSSHPRGFGNHAEYFNLRKQQGAPIGRIIQEMTSLPAEIFSLPQIGAIKKSFRAVFTLLKPEEYCSNATFSDPHQTASGSEIIRL